jgi:hypothetical protein
LDLIIAENLTQGAYGRPNSMRDYLCFRVSQKEPLDRLYFTPAVKCQGHWHLKRNCITVVFAPG